MAILRDNLETHAPLADITCGALELPAGRRRGLWGARDRTVPNKIDYLAFALLTLLLFGALRAWLSRPQRRGVVASLPWLAILVVLAGGYVAVQSASDRTRHRLASMVSGYAPTYAQQLTKLGHAQLSLDTSPDDPRYLQMIQAQIDWLKANPTASDIYTFRKRADGQTALMVDSETDYDHSGSYNAPREERTLIGELYEEEGPELELAFAGQAIFAPNPVTDRWGTWVSAYQPMFDENGQVEAVLGVDFDATQWITEIQASRWSVIGYVALLVLLLGAGSTFIEVLYDSLTRAKSAEAHAREAASVCELAKSELRINEARLRIMVENLPGGAVYWDGTTLTVNRAVERITGYPREELATLDMWFEKIYRDQAVAVRKEYEADRTQGFPAPRTIVLHRCDDTARQVEFSAYRDGKGEVWMLHDVTERHDMEATLRQRSLHDPLTNLANREMFRQRLTECLERSVREPGYRFATLFMDLDRFKLINDMLGHTAGDNLLKIFASRLRRAAQACADAGLGRDHVTARLGGDEFTVLLNNLSAPEQAAAVAEHLLAAITAPVILGGHEVFPSTSIGIVLNDSRYTTAEEILRDADTAMYRAKTNGRGRAEIFDEGMRNEIVDRISLETDLRRALERGELFLNFQPLIDLESSRLVGFEALARWKHPTRGMISPVQFIPIAEESGLILPIGEWVMKEACRQLVQWQHRFPQMGTVSMSVNLSRKQLLQSDLIERVSCALRETSLSPSQLVLEITESTVMSNMENGLVLLNNLRNIGICLSMDDFGTGYSSLSCLHRFPLNSLKIDRSFIMNLSTRRDYAAVIHAIVALSHNLGMRVTAEGVETADHVVQLQALECDVAQGYYFAKPLSAADAEAFIRKHCCIAASRVG